MKWYFVGAFVALGASAVAEDFNSNPPGCNKENNFCQGFEMSITDKPTHMIGFELNGKGGIAQLIRFELTEGANAMLHGYVPHNNDVVEWYVRSVNCAEPDKSCSFELAIRKAKWHWPF